MWWCGIRSTCGGGVLGARVMVGVLETRDVGVLEARVVIEY